MIETETTKKKLTHILLLRRLKKKLKKKCRINHQTIDIKSDFEHRIEWSKNSQTKNNLRTMELGWKHQVKRYESRTDWDKLTVDRLMAIKVVLSTDEKQIQYSWRIRTRSSTRRLGRTSRTRIKLQLNPTTLEQKISKNYTDTDLCSATLVPSDYW